MNMKELENKLVEAEYKKAILIQQFIDTVEKQKGIVTEQLFKKQCLVIKALNKRITFLKTYFEGLK